MRQLIEEDLIPDDVTIQVLTQAREPLIGRTFESLRGREARDRASLQLDVDHCSAASCSASTAPGIVEIAVRRRDVVRDCAAEQPDTDWTFQYSPESFTGTELDFAKEICDAVIDVWQPTPAAQGDPQPAGDGGDGDAQRLRRPDRVDAPQSRAPRQRRALAASAQRPRHAASPPPSSALMAGADRVEGCLFGNGERTGNVCLVTLGLNLYTQGIDPGIDFSDIGEIIRTVEYCNQLPVHPRHPYGGELVFTAFSGSHQDAIKKGLAAQREPRSRAATQLWDVPYLPIDPADVGRTYEAVIRVNSQSGKGGIAYLLERDYGLALPRLLQIEFSQVIQRITDATGKELSAAEIRAAFEREYVRGDAAGHLRRPSRAAQRRRRHGRAADRASSRSTGVETRAARRAATGRSTRSSQAVRDGTGRRHPRA